MATDSSRPDRRALLPVHAVLLASVLPLLLGTLLSDWAYVRTFEVQWINFAAWLIVGGLIFNIMALLWAVIDSLRADAPRRRGKWVYPSLLAATLVLGFVNAIVHAKDGWAIMPLGLILSVIALIVGVAAIWAGFRAPRAGDSR